MASVMEKTLLKAAGVKPQKDGEDRQKYLTRLVLAVLDLAEKDWGKLEDDAQDWVNTNGERHNKEKALKEFPDLEEEEGDDDEDEAPKAKTKVKAKSDDDEDDEAADDDEDEPAPKKKVKAKPADDEDDEDAPSSDDDDEDEEDEPAKTKAKKYVPEVGDKVVYKREGKKDLVCRVTGVEVDEKTLTVKTTSLAENKKFADVAFADVAPYVDSADGDDDDEPSKPAKKAKVEDDSEDEDEKPSKKRNPDAKPGGVNFIVNTVCKNPGWSKQKVSDKVSAAGYEVAPATLNIQYNGAHKILKALHEAGNYPDYPLAGGGEAKETTKAKKKAASADEEDDD